jgi:hypothetical protein
MYHVKLGHDRKTERMKEWKERERERENILISFSLNMGEYAKVGYRNAFQVVPIEEFF